MQKNKLFHLALAGFIVINSSSVNAQVVEVDKKTRDRVAGSTQPKGVDPSKVKLVPADPAVQTINLSAVSCKSPLDGIVKIEGVIKNIGKADFFYTGDDKIEVILFEEVRGAVPPKNVASLRVFRLNAGAELRVSYTRNWNKSDEYPPKYTLVIRYDVSEFSRRINSVQNTDSNTGNNKLTINGQLINDMRFPCK